MDATQRSIPVLQPEEKVIGSAYLTQDGEIVFTYHSDSLEVVLVEPQVVSLGPWAVRLRPLAHARAGSAAVA